MRARPITAAADTAKADKTRYRKVKMRKIRRNEVEYERLNRVPVREQDPKVRATNFDEVCLGYNKEEAMAEASRCLNCKNAKCVQGCPVSINIPAFVKSGKGRKVHRSCRYHCRIICTSGSLWTCMSAGEHSAKASVSAVLRVILFPSVKLERFVADYSREHGYVPKKPETTNGKKVAIIGSGPAGLTCAGDLAKLGYEVTIFEALHEPGGVLTYGIPEFRLPKDEVVQKEIDNVRKLGVKIECRRCYRKVCYH